MADSCKIKNIDVYVQENGIIRIRPTHELIGRLVDGISFENLKTRKERCKCNGKSNK